MTEDTRQRIRFTSPDFKGELEISEEGLKKLQTNILKGQLTVSQFKGMFDVVSAKEMFSEAQHGQYGAIPIVAQHFNHRGMLQSLPDGTPAEKKWDANGCLYSEMDYQDGQLWDPDKGVPANRMYHPDGTLSDVKFAHSQSAQPPKQETIEAIEKHHERILDVRVQNRRGYAMETAKLDR